MLRSRHLRPGRRGRAALAAGALAAVLGACSGAQDPGPAAPQGRPSDLGSESAELTRVQEPPARPPALTLLVGGEPAQQGVVYNGEWGRAALLEASPVPWPAPAAVDDAAGAALMIGAGVLPRALTVEVYLGAVTAAGEPAGPAAHSVDCGKQELLSREGACQLHRSGGGLRLALPAPLTGTSRIAVNVSWAVPPRAGDREPGFDWATWLFRTVGG